MRGLPWLFALLIACDAGPASAPSRVPPPTRDAAPSGASAQVPGEAPGPSDRREGQVGELHYLELMSGGARFADRVPIVVAIHGLGDSPEGFVGLVEGFDRPARFIIPRALDPHEPGWSWFPIRARDPDVEGLAQGIVRAADAIEAGLAKLAEQRPEADEVIVTGFSQGGMLTFTLATRHPRRVDAAVAVGGWLPPPLWPESAPEGAPTLVALHGTDDPAVKFPPTEAAVEALRARGWPASLHAYPGVQHAIPPAMRAELFELLRQSVDARARELEVGTAAEGSKP